MTVYDTERRREPVGYIDKAVDKAFRQWVGFWFTPADPAPLCLLRILVGGMLVYSHLVWGIDLQAFLGPDGWNSAELVREFQRGQWNSSFWWLVPVDSMQTVHQCCIGILVLYCLGFCTRITSILAFVIHVSYCQRAALSNFGLDQICGILVMYLMIAPCGARYSIDRLLWYCWRKGRVAQGDRNENPVRVDPSMAAGLSLRLIQFHYCVIYFFAATGKLQGETWWNGAAIWRAIANYEYQSTDLTWLAWYPEILQLVTHVAILWELSFAYLVWVKPLRPVILGIGVLVHLGIGAFFGMWTFGLTMIFGYLAFIKPETVRAAMALPFKFAGSRAKPTGE